MQQWVCHIQGLENIFGAREVEKIGRQIDGVEDLSVDFAGETLVLKANSTDVLKRLEKKLALSGYRLVKKDYCVISVINIPTLESPEVREIVRKTIGSHSQVRKLEIKPLSKMVNLTHDIDFPIAGFVCDLNNQQVAAHLRNQSYLKSRWQIFAHFSVMIAALLFVAGIVLEGFYFDSFNALICYLFSLSITGVLLAKRAVTQLVLHRKLTYVFLMLLVTIIAVSQRLWFESSLLALSLAVSFMFEERAGWQLKQQWSLLKSMLPLFAFTKKGDDRHAIPISKIGVEDILVVQQGEYVPVDGEIIQGAGIFDASNIVVNSDILDLNTGDKIYAGLKMRHGSIEMKVSKVSHESVLYLLMKRLESLQTQITPKQKKITAKLDYMLYGFLTIASALLVMQYMPDPVLSPVWLEKSLALLVISGSAFVLTSMQFSHLFSYLYAAKNGIYFFDPLIWRSLVKSEGIILDKTGVITNNHPEVQEVISLGSHATQDILSFAASLASASENSKFLPIVKRADSNNVVFQMVDELVDSSNKYVRAKINGNILTLGSQNAIENMGLLSKEIVSKLKRWQGEGENVFLLTDESQVIGLITVLDPVRSEVGEFVEFGHFLGFKKIQLMTSDNEGASQIIANRYGFDQVFADLSGDEKEKHLENIATDESVISISNGMKPSKNHILSMQIDALQSGVSAHQIISLGKNLLVIPYLLQLAKKLDSRMNSMVTLIINIKLLVLIAIFTNTIGLDHVIIIEFLLATWVMSSTYKPKNMFNES